MADVLNVVKSLRSHYPTPMSDAQRGDLLNRAAWVAGDGWGLLDKPSESHVPQPRTGHLVAGDILFDRTSGHHFDVLVDGEGDARPEFIDDGPMDPSRWVAPVEPSSTMPDGSGSTKSDPPDQTPKPPSDRGLEGILERLTAIQEKLDTLAATLDRLSSRPAPPYSAPLGPFGTIVLHPVDQK